MTNQFLAFDCGATSGRAVLATFSDGAFDMKEVYRFPSGIIELNGKYYWDILAIYDHFRKCLAQLGREGVRIDSIGIDTWGVDFGFVADDGSLLGNPRAYRDPYTDGIPEEVFRTVPREELYGATGIQIMNFNSIFQLYAQTKEGFAPLRCADKVLFIPDLLSYMLTGNKVCEYTIASTSGMMDQTSRQFNETLLEKLGIRTDVLLPITQPGAVVGTLRKEIAEACGVPQVPVIAVAGHDTAAAIAAVPSADEKFAYLSSGTWSLMGIETPAPIINEDSTRLNFTNEGGIDGTTRFLKNITGMWILEQSRKVWAAEGRTYNYGEMEKMARSEAAFPSTINPDDPRFAAPANMVEAIDGYLRETGQQVPENDAQYISCIYRSLARRYKAVVDMLQGFAPFPIEKLHVIGGGSANDTMSQWTADELGIPVVAGPTEATAIGNVMIQARAAGLVKDRWEMRNMIAKAFAVKTFTPDK
ncbi:MAG: rhamnulokinase [Bacteroidales bacterium]|nr:rhamnulokinase [Bacteroidales bacterium]MBR5256450.1 rhamnulokinase [Bacteroidales bacterium]